MTIVAWASLGCLLARQLPEACCKSAHQLAPTRIEAWLDSKVEPLSQRNALSLTDRCPRLDRRHRLLLVRQIIALGEWTKHAYRQLTSVGQFQVVFLRLSKPVLASSAASCKPILAVALCVDAQTSAHPPSSLASAANLDLPLALLGIRDKSSWQHSQI